MNYIIAFFYEYVGFKEAEAFYYCVGLFMYTDVSQIVLNDFIKLRKYFYIFERLLELYIPEIYELFSVSFKIILGKFDNSKLILLNCILNFTYKSLSLF
jgi:hypothetical protein